MTTLEEAAFAGDEAAFADLAGRHRRELHVHCYRMLGSSHDGDESTHRGDFLDLLLDKPLHELVRGEVVLVACPLCQLIDGR